jgi:anti-sigma B factor antagonist
MGNGVAYTPVQFSGSTIVILHVQGARVDAHHAGELKSRLLELAAAGKSNIVVDLTEVRFIDSSGLGALIAAYKSAAAKASVLKLAGLQPQVRSVMELTGMHRVFEVFESVAQAMEAVQVF